MRWPQRRVRRARPGRTVKPCGPDIPTLVSSSRSLLRRPAGDGGNKARFPGEITEQPFQPLRGECRVVPVPPL